MGKSIAIVSGYFNPLHVGHLRMMREARDLADLLIVIVNNDDQQMLKKGRIVIPAIDRLAIVESIRFVDEAMLAVDHDSTVIKTLSEIRSRYPDARLIFANGGDRSDSGAIAEADVCAELDIETIFGVGGHEKADASSRIIEEAGL
jgi:glycerol-3-phosphate cytidylyltransferase/D-beta-D-heptose 7-phosphate kinase/D-beta-D-heptose 1-phosphate adenosyltransferase